LVWCENQPHQFLLTQHSSYWVFLHHLITFIVFVLYSFLVSPSRWRSLISYTPFSCALLIHSFRLSFLHSFSNCENAPIICMIITIDGFTFPSTKVVIPRSSIWRETPLSWKKFITESKSFKLLEISSTG